MQIEIPLTDSLADAERVVALQQKTASSRCAATRAASHAAKPSHQWVHRKIGG